MKGVFQDLERPSAEGRLRLVARTSAVIVPLLFGAILWMQHADTLGGKGSAFAYPDRMLLWYNVSYWSHQGAPPLAVGGNQGGPLRPVEMVYTDDMGFPFLVDLATRATGRVLGPPDFFAIVWGLNLLLLYALLASLWRCPLALLTASILILFPSFYIPRLVVGPDLFCLYGTFSLMGLTAVMLVFHRRNPFCWWSAGVLLMSVYLMRQAIGIILILAVLMTVPFWFLERSRRNLAACRRMLVMLLGMAMISGGFHGTLAWRDARLGIRPEENQASKHHTIFHPLYVGIGNIKDNPWGIVYSDKYAFDQILGKGNFETAQPCSPEYLRGVRARYLAMWKNDGVRLAWWYTRHLGFVVGATLGWTIFLPGIGYAVGVAIRQWRTAQPASLLETAIIALAITLFGFLVQSTLVDYRLLYSYPTGLLGRYLLGFSMVDFGQRLWLKHRSNHACDLPTGALTKAIT